MLRILAVPLLLLAVSVTCPAQETEDVLPPQVATPTAPELPPMVAPWGHPEGYQSYESPREAVHRAAAFKAAQRRQRIAARKSLGYSPLRPPASSVPFMSGGSHWMIIRPPLYIPTVYVVPRQPAVVVGSARGGAGY